MRPSLFHIANRALNRPLLMAPDKALIVADVLAGRIGIDAPDLGGLTPDANQFYGSRRRESGASAMSPAVSGTVIITIAGSLVNRGAWIGASSGLVSYEGIAAQVAETSADPEIHSVILDIDSGGGEAGGIASLGDQIRALRDRKRVVAVVNDTACSAAYWIASQASEIVISETGMIGSIGVVVLHVDRSGEMQQKGWAPTLIHAGANKVDMNPFGPLAENVRADVQQMVDGLREQFVTAVAAGRGDRLTKDQARATEARVFHGAEAVRLGLADRIGTIDTILADLRKRPKLGKPATADRSVRYFGAPAAAAQAGPSKAGADIAAIRKRVVARTNKNRGF